MRRVDVLGPGRSGPEHLLAPKSERADKPKREGKTNQIKLGGVTSWLESEVRLQVFLPKM